MFPIDYHETCTLKYAHYKFIFQVKIAEAKRQSNYSVEVKFAVLRSGEPVQAKVVESTMK